MLNNLKNQLSLFYYLAKKGLPDLWFYTPKQELMGMTIKWEQAYLQRYAEKEYSGQGEIVDYGCWLGSSLIPMAIGLERNRKVEQKKQRIHAYDIFIWQSWMERIVLNTSLAGKYQAGDSFVDEFHKIIAPWQNIIEVHAGDVNQIGWQCNPIEIFHNDASKTWDLTNTMLQKFYPFLIPGVSICVEQDFSNYYTPWVNLICYRLQNYFQPILHIPYSSSVVFRNIKAIPEELLSADYSFSSFSEQEIEACFQEYSLNLVAKNKQANVLAAKVMFYIHAGDKERAWYELERAKNNGYYESEMVKVKNIYFPEKN